jgi:hypothetical protein
VIIKLLGESLEDRVKLCFVLGECNRTTQLIEAALVSDDASLQQKAAEKGCPSLVVAMLSEVIKAEQDGSIGLDLSSRAREVSVEITSLSLGNAPRSGSSVFPDRIDPYLYRRS